MANGGRGGAQDRPLCLEAYSDYKALGRVTLRDGGVTLAVGVVTSVDCA